MRLINKLKYGILLSNLDVRNENKMEAVKNFFSNQWVINIGTGLIVYIVTTIISRIIINKAANKQKQQQIENANSEIIRILKPYVVERNILNKMIINSITESVARKYNLSIDEVLNVRAICEELIREILESSYVDNEKKSEYVVYLNDIIADFKSIDEYIQSIEQLSTKQNKLRNYSKLYSLISFSMISIVLLISILVTLFSEEDLKFIFSNSEPVQITVLILIAELGTMLSVMTVILANNRNKYKRRIERIETDYQKNSIVLENPKI